MKTGVHPESKWASVPLAGKSITYNAQSVPLTYMPVVHFDACNLLINKEVAHLPRLNSEGGHL